MSYLEVYFFFVVFKQIGKSVRYYWMVLRGMDLVFYYLYYVFVFVYWNWEVVYKVFGLMYLDISKVVFQKVVLDFVVVVEMQVNVGLGGE